MAKHQETLIDNIILANILVKVYSYIGDCASPPDVHLKPRCITAQQLCYRSHGNMMVSKDMDMK